MVLIRDLIQEALESGYLSQETEEQLEEFLEICRNDEYFDEVYKPRDRGLNRIQPLENPVCPSRSLRQHGSGICRLTVGISSRHLGRPQMLVSDVAGSAPHFLTELEQTAIADEVHPKTRQQKTDTNFKRAYQITALIAATVITLSISGSIETAVVGEDLSSTKLQLNFK